MSVAASTSACAAAAAEAEQRRQHEEEEEMTSYTPQDLSQDWEFKILRTTMGAFRKPEFLRQCLEDESRAGWVLVEKFDDYRLRLKRPASARERDGKLADIDPYRTNVGLSQNALSLAVVGISLGVALGVLLVIALMANVR